MDDRLNSHRLTDYMHAIWEQAKGERRFPAVEDINADDLAPQHKKDIFILEINHNATKHTVNVKFIGDDLKAEHSDDSALAVFLESHMEHYDKVIQSRREIIQSIEIPQGSGKSLKYRQILLPLGPDDNMPINAIIGGMRYKKD